MSENGEDNSDEARSAIDEAAVHWLVELSDASLLAQASVLAEFTRWSEADPRHAETFARLKATWTAVGSLSDAPELAPMRQDAVDELARLRSRARQKSAGWFALQAGLGLASAATIAVVAYLTFWPSVQGFTTAVGERRTITLADRSVVEMDADTSLTINYSPHERLINVLKGEAYFRVAKNPDRPFVVECHDRTVTATGTEFDVEALEDGLQVTLVQGHVRVNAGQSTLGSLDPGDSLTTRVGRVPRRVHQANILALLAWRAGRLVFDDLPLPEAVAHLGRYSQTRIVVDSSLAGLKISGVFKTGDLSGFLGAVESYYPVVATSRDGSLELTRKP